MTLTAGRFAFTAAISAAAFSRRICARNTVSLCRMISSFGFGRENIAFGPSIDDEILLDEATQDRSGDRLSKSLTDEFDYKLNSKRHQPFRRTASADFPVAGVCQQSEILFAGRFQLGARLWNRTGARRSIRTLPKRRRSSLPSVFPASCTRMRSLYWIRKNRRPRDADELMQTSEIYASISDSQMECLCLNRKATIRRLIGYLKESRYLLLPGVRNDNRRQCARFVRTEADRHGNRCHRRPGQVNLNKFSTTASWWSRSMSFPACWPILQIILFAGVKDHAPDAQAGVRASAGTAGQLFRPQSDRRYRVQDFLRYRYDPPRFPATSFSWLPGWSPFSVRYLWCCRSRRRWCWSSSSPCRSRWCLRATGWSRWSRCSAGVPASWASWTALPRKKCCPATRRSRPMVRKTRSITKYDGRNEGSQSGVLPWIMRRRHGTFRQLCQQSFAFLNQYVRRDLVLMGKITIDQYSSFVFRNSPRSDQRNGQYRAEAQTAAAAASRCSALDEPSEIRARPTLRFWSTRRAWLISITFDSDIRRRKKLSTAGACRSGTTSRDCPEQPARVRRRSSICWCRFYDVNEGVISIWRLIRSCLTATVCAKAFTMVFAGCMAVSKARWEERRYAREDATLEEVIVCESAYSRLCGNIFAAELSNSLTDDGVNISRVRKQLLTIARAMLSNARMLILDESDFNVDSRTEMAIQDAMLELMKGGTCFVIAHRLSTIKNADVILVLKDGKHHRVKGRDPGCFRQEGSTRNCLTASLSWIKIGRLEWINSNRF